MIDLYIGPRESIIRPLLQVERVELVGLRCGAGHEAVEYGGVVLYTGAEMRGPRKGD